MGYVNTIMRADNDIKSASQTHCQQHDSFKLNKKRRHILPSSLIKFFVQCLQRKRTNDSQTYGLVVKTISYEQRQFICLYKHLAQYASEWGITRGGGMCQPFVTSARPSRTVIRNCLPITLNGLPATDYWQHP